MSITLVDYCAAHPLSSTFEPMRPARYRAMQLLVLCSLAVRSQDVHLAGTVTGPDLKPVEAAVVTIIQPDSGWKRAVLSNRQGSFQLTQFPPGRYRVEVVKPGFKPLILPRVDVPAQDTPVLDLRMMDADPEP
jgi:Carboxypeptidase regulatory-like domain